MEEEIPEDPSLKISSDTEVNEEQAGPSASPTPTASTNTTTSSRTSVISQGSIKQSFNRIMAFKGKSIPNNANY